MNSPRICDMTSTSDQFALDLISLPFIPPFVLEKPRTSFSLPCAFASFNAKISRMAIPLTQIAAVIPSSGAGGTLSVEISNTHPVPIPGDGDALIKLEFSGVCHSDVHSIRGDTLMSTDVAGHEGVGKVIQGLRYPMALNNHDSNVFYGTVGSGVDESLWIGQMVGIRSISRSNINPQSEANCFI